MSPHAPTVPTSIWRLPYPTYRLLAASADAYAEEMKRSHD